MYITVEILVSYRDSHVLSLSNKITVFVHCCM